MQILMLAAGESSRFWPFSERNHKAFLKIGDKLILEHVIDQLEGHEIILVVNPKRDIGEKIRKKEDIKLLDQSEPLGMADAILKAKGLIKEDIISVMPYHINLADSIDVIKEVKAPAIAVKPYIEGDELTRGIVKIKDGKIVEIREKEKFEEATHAITGIYKLNSAILDELEKDSGKISFEETLNRIAKKEGINYFELDAMPSLKYVTDLLNIRDLIYYSIKKRISNKKEHQEKQIEDTVIIGNNVELGNNVSIKGNTFIGDNSFVGDNSLIRDSIIGENCRIGANFITGNKRIDRGNIKIKVKNKDYDTGMKRLGVIMGDNVKTGINVSAMPGTLIGNHSIIGSNTEIKGKIDSNKMLYSKTNLIEKDI
jgi:NDP-sugar pyrophosphorylase family protein